VGPPRLLELFKESLWSPFNLEKERQPPRDQDKDIATKANVEIGLIISTKM